MAMVSSSAMWFAKNNGTIAINWLGWQISTSISFFIISIICFLFFFLFTLLLLIKIISFPSKIKKNLKLSRIRKARVALHEGVIASSYGDMRLTKKKYFLAKNNLKESPLLLFLKLQINDNRTNEADNFKILTKMLSYKVTRPLALKGIIKFANKKNDIELFNNMLSKSREYGISINLINNECISFCIKNNNWMDFSNFLKKKRLNKDTKTKNIEGLIDFQIANDFFLKGNKKKAKEYIIKAMDTNKSFPPFVELFCKLKIAKSKRQLIKVLKRYWEDFPHPNIQKCLEYGLESKDQKLQIASLNDILKRSKNSHIKYLVYGKMKYEAKLWGEARKDIIKSINIKPSKEAYLYLAKIEKLFSREQNKADKWIKLSNQIEDDFKWICNFCSHYQFKWSIYCQNCKEFNSLFWSSNNSLDLNKDNSTTNQISII